MYGEGAKETHRPAPWDTGRPSKCPRELQFPGGTTRNPWSLPTDCGCFTAYSGPMAIIRATVRLHHVNGLPLDDVVNVWHFQSLTPLDSAISTKLAIGLEAFYRPLYVWFSGVQVRTVGNGGTIQTSEVTPGAAGAGDDVTSRVFMTHAIPTTTAFPATTGANFPGEVAACLSFAGDIEGIPEESGGTRPAARRRGRIYLGRLATTSGTAGITANTVTPRINLGALAFGDVAMDEYEDLAAALSPAPNSLLHIIYSPTSAAEHVVTVVSMDDAYDTIRSRGVDPTVRSSRPVAWGSA